jgi:alpha-tubulin suppressor-like RCC1 family protein
MRTPLESVSQVGRFLSIGAAFLIFGCGESTTAPPAVRLAFTSIPSFGVAGVTMGPVTVAVQDEEGHIATSANNTVTLAIGSNPAGGTLSGLVTVHAIDGIATFNDLRIRRSGSGYTFSATSSGLAPANSAPFSIVNAPDSKIDFTVQPVGGIANASMAPFTVGVQDSLGNVGGTAIRSITVSLGPNSNGAVMNGQISRVTSQGVAVFGGLTISKPGTYTIVATTTGFGPATSATFNMTVGPATKLGVVSPAIAEPGAVLTPPLVIRVLDFFSNPVTTGSYDVSLELADGTAGAKLSGTTTLSTVNGVATFSDLSIDKPGEDYRIAARTQNFLETFRSAPLSIRAPLTLASASAGYFHSCGLAGDGTAYCWGSNDEGQLTGLVNPRIVPAVTAGVRFSSISTGRSHTCALASNGAPYCWGSSTTGQTGTTAGGSTPQPLPGGFVFASISAGYSHTCALTAAGAAYCWGDNSAGELGTPRESGPSISPVDGGLTFRNISAGRYFTCGVTTDSKGYCWGDNSIGELGNGTTTSAKSPSLVSADLKFSTVLAGGFHACGLTVEGKVYCWGQSTFGQLGNGSLGYATLPVAIASSHTFASLSVGNRHSCAVTSAGSGYCWGDNGNGNLGNGSTALSTIPFEVSGGLSFLSISAGRFHSCAVTAGNVVYCWGENTVGELGNGTQTTSLIPVRVR